MSLDQLLEWIPTGGPEEALARQVEFDRLPRHVAIIMDGNGRWAGERRLPRVEGHRAGVDSVRDVIETSARLGLEVLTLYAFSVENWKRPAAEVSTLMMLLKRYLGLELETLLRNNIRFNVIGRSEALAPDIRTELLDAERKTMTELYSFGYGGRQPGMFLGVHSIATDSKGNLYTTETYTGKRLQKFVYKGLGAIPKSSKVPAWPGSGN